MLLANGYFNYSTNVQFVKLLRDNFIFYEVNAMLILYVNSELLFGGDKVLSTDLHFGYRLKFLQNAHTPGLMVGWPQLGQGCSSPSRAASGSSRKAPFFLALRKPT